MHNRYYVLFYISKFYRSSIKICEFSAFSFLSSLLFLMCSIGPGRETSLVAQMVEHLPTIWETWVRFLGWEDPLEKEMATHSRTIAWRIPWTEEPGRLQSTGSQRVGHDFTFTFRGLIISAPAFPLYK